MDNLAEMFRDGFKSNGIDAEVEAFEDPSTMNEVVNIKASINGEEFRKRYEIPWRERDQIQMPQQYVAQITDEMSRSMREKFHDSIEWGERRVEIDFSDDHKATCMICGTSVTAEQMLQEAAHPIVAESTVPKPTSPSVDSIHSQKLRMAMLALLRNECDDFCDQKI